MRSLLLSYRYIVCAVNGYTKKYSRATVQTIFVATDMFTQTTQLGVTWSANYGVMSKHGNRNRILRPHNFCSDTALNLFIASASVLCGRRAAAPAL